MISTCLPEYFVVPSSLADQDLKTFSHSFVGRRMPVWSWSHSNGSALVRVAVIKDVLQQRKIDQRICNAVTKSHPQRSDVYKSDLDKTLPNIQEIQAAFVKLKQLCVNEPFEETEEKWLSSLEGTRWLEYVRAFLKHSAELVYMLESKRVSVVLQGNSWLQTLGNVQPACDQCSRTGHAQVKVITLSRLSFTALPLRTLQVLHTIEGKQWQKHKDCT